MPHNALVSRLEFAGWLEWYLYDVQKVEKDIPEECREVSLYTLLGYLVKADYSCKEVVFHHAVCVCCYVEQRKAIFLACANFFCFSSLLR